MRKHIRKWLGIGEKQSLPSPPVLISQDKISAMVVDALLQTLDETRKPLYIWRFPDYYKSTFHKALENAAVLTASNTAKYECMKHLDEINREEWLDKVVERIKRKQL
jgi:hypothetical protein